jgi:hypothetical protein
MTYKDAGFIDLGMGNMKFENKIKNDGTIESKLWNDKLADIHDGLKFYTGVKIGKDGWNPMLVGVDYSDKTVASSTLVSFENMKDMTAQQRATYNVDDNTKLGMNAEFKPSDFMGTLRHQYGLTGTVHGHGYGIVHHMLAAKNTTSQFYLHTKKGGAQAGTEVAFDHGKKAFSANVGAKVQNGDHLVGAQFSNAVLAKFFVQWNGTWKTTVGTEVDLDKVMSGYVPTLPV